MATRGGQRHRDLAGSPELIEVDPLGQGVGTNLSGAERHHEYPVDVHPIRVDAAGGAGTGRLQARCQSDSETRRIWVSAKGAEWRCRIRDLVEKRPDLAFGRKADHEVPFPANLQVLASGLGLLNEGHKGV